MVWESGRSADRGLARIQLAYRGYQRVIFRITTIHEPDSYNDFYALGLDDFNEQLIMVGLNLEELIRIEFPENSSPNN